MLLADVSFFVVMLHNNHTFLLIYCDILLIFSGLIQSHEHVLIKHADSSLYFLLLFLIVCIRLQ